MRPPVVARLRQSSLARNQVLFSPLSSIVNGGLLALSLVIATRKDQLPDIAAYMAGSAVVAVAAVLASGGSTLRYVTGTSGQRALIRGMRLTFTSPILLASALVAVTVYHATSKLPFVSLLAGGISVVINNYSEVAASDFQREQRILSMTAVLAISRVLGLTYLILGGTYSISMAVGALAYQLGLNTLLRKRGAKARPHLTPLRWRPSVLVGYDLSLLGVSLASVGILRLPFVAVPYITSHQEAGVFAALLGTQQTLLGLTTAGLYSVMAARAGSGHDVARLRSLKRQERFFILAAFAVGLALCAGTNPILRTLNLAVNTPHVAWWVLASLAIPVMTANRSLQYRWLTARHYRSALIQLVAIFALVGISCASAALSGNVTLAASSYLLGEGTVLMVAWARRASRE